MADKSHNGGSSMPPQKPGKSRQDYATPWELVRALEARFGGMDIDLAATAENRKADVHIGPEQDSLSVDWSEFSDWNCWLNPPFANLALWAGKCARHAPHFKRGRIFLLTPASMGANWFVDLVQFYAYVMALQGRITFVGEDHPYPKDCMISVYGAGVKGFEVWKWEQ